MERVVAEGQDEAPQSTPDVENAGEGGSSAADTSARRSARLTLGVCTMAAKANSAPMQAILRRLERCGDFTIVVFPEDTILTKSASDWPVVQCLIAFTSSGFPLETCNEYCNLHHPRCINNVEAQVALGSRVAMYNLLTDYCIPCPEYVVIDHLALLQEGLAGDLVENENYIMYQGKKICKPFVEKPEDGDRHDIWIYYPRSIGGGAKKLFRKVKDKSSMFDPSQNKIRRDGIYIYEPFLITQGTDIKVYTVGAGYVHAEARKAPTVDGKVQRSKDGKELRYPVVLTQGEKAIAALIVKAFRQNICGFDILRTEGGSYVCDVNGWSFVKGNQKYYNDCSTLIRKHLLEECGITGVDTSTTMILGPEEEDLKSTVAVSTHNDYSVRESAVLENAPSGSERLRSVLVVMRHGDRRPKEKLKFKSKQAAVLGYFDHVEEGTAEVKLKTPEEMETLKGHVEKAAHELRQTISNLEEACERNSVNEEALAAAQQELLNIDLLIPVLEMKDRFSGLERKVQLKATKWKTCASPTPATSSSEDPERRSSPRRVAAQVQVVAKWGGELTVKGLEQAQSLGMRLRHDLYPNDPTGLLRLHSSFRHDFKIYSSQEGRCQITAAAFTKGFLDLEGDIVPILVSLVARDSYAQGLLDEPIPKKQRDAVKKKIESLLMSYDDISSEEVLPQSCPTEHSGLRDAAHRIGSPLQLLHTIRFLAMEYTESVAAAKEKTYQEMMRQGTNGGEEENDEAHEDAVPLGEAIGVSGLDPWIPFDLKESNKRKWLHLRRKENRWRKLLHGFVRLHDEEKGMEDDSNVTYDASKIPDVWDNLYYDMLTHRNYLGEESCRIAEKMVGLLHPLNEWVCLSEFGLSQEEKLRIGVDVTWRLVGKILGDLEFMIEDDVDHVDEAGRQKLVPRDRSRMSTCTGVPRQMSDLDGFGESEAKGDDEGSGSPKRLVPRGITPEEPSSPTSRLESRPWREWNSGSASASASMPSVPGTTKEAAQEAKKEKSIGAVSPQQAEQSASRCCEERPERPVGKQPGAASSRKSKLWRMQPELRNHLKQALRDSSDWHPRLNDEVKKLTDIKNTLIVRSRVYVTSASTMHSLFNILRHGHVAGAEGPSESIISDLSGVIDLNYLTHLVFRCYERDSSAPHEAADAEATGTEGRQNTNKARYRVEISMSPGIQVYNKNGSQHVRWPKGRELHPEQCMVSPLAIIADSVELSHIERLFTEAIKEYGEAEREDDEDIDEQSE